MELLKLYVMLEFQLCFQYVFLCTSHCLHGRAVNKCSAKARFALVLFPESLWLALRWFYVFKSYFCCWFVLLSLVVPKSILCNTRSWWERETWSTVERDVFHVLATGMGLKDCCVFVLPSILLLPPHLILLHVYPMRKLHTELVTRWQCDCFSLRRWVTYVFSHDLSSFCMTQVLPWRRISWLAAQYSL